MIDAKVGQGATVCVPGGYPLELSELNETILEFMVPPDVATVTIEASSDDGETACHVALYNVPDEVGGSNGSQVADSLQDVTLNPTSDTEITVTIPASSSISVKPYVLRFWIDKATRKTDGQVRADNLDADRVPVGVSISSIAIA